MFSQIEFWPGDQQNANDILSYSIASWVESTLLLLIINIAYSFDYKGFYIQAPHNVFLFDDKHMITQTHTCS